MSGRPDPHTELGVSADATLAEIHSAFRRRLREHHPDVRGRSAGPGGEADEALQRAIAAYAALRERGPDGPHRPNPGTQVPVRRTPPDDRRFPARRPSLLVTPVRWSPATRSTND